MRHRPACALGLTLLLLLGAALACSVTVSTAHFENAAMVTDPGGESRARTYQPGDTVYVIAEVKDIDEAEVLAIWSRLTLDEQDRVIDAVEIDRDTITTGTARLVFEMSPEDSEQEAWPRGRYRVELFIDGDRGKTLDFQIR